MQDPDGVEWEVYVLNYDLEDESSLIGSQRTLPLAQTAACCSAS